MDRYAVYYLPPEGSALAAFGTRLLGYDVDRGEEVPFPPGLPVDRTLWTTLTEEPRRYGFHATLKAPFRLKPGVREADLVATAAEFAGRRPPAECPGLRVARLGGFVALVPAAPAPSIDALAADCVTAFERFRSPLSQDEMARRLAAPLTAVQLGYLRDWGYPSVFDEFRFHMTLTGGLPDALRGPVESWLADAFASVPPLVVLGEIAILRQPAGGRFVTVARLPLQGA